MTLEVLDLGRAAPRSHPLLDPPAWTLERLHTHCRPPELYAKSFSAKTHPMNLGCE